MRVGLLYQRAGTGVEVTAAVEQIVAADRLGFDSVWLEDRRGEEGAFGSLPVALAALARRTRAIRLGGFTVAALDHPAATAEDFAVADLVSGGRLNFGVSVGSRPEDFRAHGVPFEERGARLREALEIVLAAWAFDEFSYGGRYYRFPAHVAPGSGLARRRLGREPRAPQWERGPETPDFLTVTPKPLQEPRPPVWVLAEDEDWVVFAAERGHSVVLPPADPERLAAAAEIYDDALARAGRARSEVELAVIVELPLAGGRVAPDTVERLHRIHGATGANHVLWRVPHPGTDPVALEAALRQFAAEVQPLLQA
jgi:alkanesulfonate monooxygenase SsuD/methylene tetrahydromethanopterin reductase-like flavin-dependent oxidoreductase (luciferase family)